MPMSQERKAEYNKRYYREKKLGILKPIQIPKVAGLVMQGNRILGVEKKVVDKSRYNNDDVIPNLPICNEYNFRQFEPGDKVLVRRGKRLIETVIPELDAGGQPVPDWA